MLAAVTHIVTAVPNIKRALLEELCSAELGTPYTIPKDVTVVTYEWFSRCYFKTTRVSEADFVIDIDSATVSPSAFAPDGTNKAAVSRAPSSKQPRGRKRTRAEEQDTPPRSQSSRDAAPLKLPRGGTKGSPGSESGVVVPSKGVGLHALGPSFFKVGQGHHLAVSMEPSNVVDPDALQLKCNGKVYGHVGTFYGKNHGVRQSSKLDAHAVKALITQWNCAVTGVVTEPTGSSLATAGYRIDLTIRCLPSQLPSIRDALQEMDILFYSL
jgi:hypothetical protein